MRRKRRIPLDHPPFAGLPVQLLTLDHGAATAAVHVAGTLSSRALPLICIPGYQRNMSDFADLLSQFQHMMGADWPVVLIDLQGRGRSSDRADAGDYGSPRDARDIADIAAALGINAAIFLGQGYGGQVLMTLAALQPRLLAGVVLLDAGPVTDSRGIVRLRNNMRHIESLRGSKLVTAGFTRMLLGDYPGASETQLATLMQRSHYLDRRGRAFPLYDHRLTEALDAFSHDDVLVAQWPLFDALKVVPLMLLRTQLTDQVRRDTFEEMTKWRPEAVTLTIQGQGSPALFDQGEEVDAIAQFVRQIVGKRLR